MYKTPENKTGWGDHRRKKNVHFWKKCISFTSVHELLNHSFYWLLCLLHTNMSSLSLGMVSAQGYCKYGFLFISLYWAILLIYILSAIIVDGIKILNYGNFMQNRHTNITCLIGLCALQLRYWKDICHLKTWISPSLPS